MEYRYIGKSGLRVTPICLGTMTFGSFASEKESFSIMDRAYDRGINFFDTAELYPVPPKAEDVGITEEIIGRWLKDRPRDSIIIASKVAGAASGWFVPPVRYGLTAIDKFHINKAVDETLKRLGTDYIDLYQVHWPDTIVELDESLEALNDLVKSGKVRYIGTSNDTAYGLAKANEISRFRGFKRFESIQNNFSLLNQRALDEIAQVCKKEKISLLPYSPIGGGVLSGKYNNRSSLSKNARFETYRNSKNPRLAMQSKKFLNKKTLESTKKYASIAKKHGLSPVSMAVAWSKQFDFVASTIIGVSNVRQLKPIFDASELILSEDILGELSQVHKDILYPMENF
jgi:aryl-alcohol dehydrogenase-like predicted oxidoreductase